MIMIRVIVAATLGLAAALGLTLAVVPAASGAPFNTYTVSRTVGPYRGDAKLGEPGSVPDGEAVTIGCRTDRYPFGDNILRGSATINRKTAYGTTSREVLTLNVIGSGYDPDTGRLYWGAYVNPTGRKGWNNVTLTVTCYRG